MSSRMLRLAAMASATLLALLLIATEVTLVSRAGPLGPAEAGVGGAENARSTATAWSSGWVAMEPGEYRTFFHNLGRPPEEYAVDLLFRDTDGELGIHRRFYGGADDSAGEYGVHWLNLTSDSIRVHRWSGDSGADEILVRVWVQDPAPDYDSGWFLLGASQTVTLTHRLGRTPTELSVHLWFRSDTGVGINHFGYGGLAYDGNGTLHGAYWHSPTNNTVRVTRLGGSAAAQLRVTVSRSAAPAYDSLVDRGWQAVAPGATFTFQHNLGASPADMVVRTECLSPDPNLGMHQAFAGGDYDWRLPGWQGANWQELTASTVTVYRQPQDPLCPAVRVVIFTQGHTLYLPVVRR